MADYVDTNVEDLVNGLRTASIMTPSEYQYFQGLKRRRIILNDIVDANIIEQVMIPLIDMDEDGSGEPIEILLSTSGGSVFDSMSLCDVIDNLKTPTTIKCMSYAYSMGGLLLMAGFSNPNVKKVCYKHSTALLHAGNDYLEGSATSVKDTFHFIQKFEEKIKAYTLSHSRISEEEYQKMEAHEWYMTSEDMLRCGLVDEII